MSGIRSVPQVYSAHIESYDCVQGITHRNQQAIRVYSKGDPVCVQRMLCEVNLNVTLWWFFSIQFQCRRKAKVSFIAKQTYRVIEISDSIQC